MVTVLRGRAAQLFEDIALGALDKTTALEVFDGVMLSDGTLILGSTHSTNRCFKLAQSGWKHSDWLYYVQGTLEVLDISCPAPTETMSVSKGKPYEYCQLRSNTSPFLTYQYRRWYPNGDRKVVPKDLRLTPIVVANWFMGDGSSAWNNGNRENGVVAYFATLGFSEEAIEILESQLERIGLPHIGRVHQKTSRGSGISVTVLGGSVGALMDMVEPYVLPSFEYKIKRPGEKSLWSC